MSLNIDGEQMSTISTKLTATSPAMNTKRLRHTCLGTLEIKCMVRNRHKINVTELNRLMG
jgi:hypothetical protein